MPFTFTIRQWLTPAMMVFCTTLSYQATAQWATMPSAPKHTPLAAPQSNDFTVTNLVAPAPGVLWGAYRGSGYRYFTAGFFRTMDNGQTWQTEITTTYGGTYTGNAPVDFSVLDAANAWVVTYTTSGSGPVPVTSTVRKTTNGPGASTSNFAAVSTNLPALFRRIHFFNATTGVAVAEPGNGSTNWQIYRSTDAGSTWTVVTATLPAVWVGPDLERLVAKVAKGPRLWVATANGNVLQTMDNGLTWTSASTGLGTALAGIAFRDASNGLAYGTNRQLARTVDGGLTWTPIANALPNGAVAIATKPGASGAYICAASSPSGIIATSSDDGATWQTQFSDNLGYNNLALSPDGQLWAGVNWNYSDTVFPGLDVLLRYVGSPLATRGEKKAELLAYPNPATGLLHLPGAEGSTVRICDATGRQCNCPRTASGIDFSAVPMGLYIVTVTDASGKSTTQRIAVMH